MKEYSNKVVVKSNINECIELIQNGKTNRELKQYWVNKGYKPSTAELYIHKSYNKLSEDIKREYPTLREKHISLYNYIIEKCLKENNMKWLFAALKRIEILTGLPIVNPITPNLIQNNTNININFRDLGMDSPNLLKNIT